MTNMLPNAPNNCALFFDFDGTLVEIAARSDLVQVESFVLEVLSGLESRYGGAVAVVTGRPLDVVDAFLAPLKLAVAAEHGSVRRDASGHVHLNEDNAGSIEAAYGALAPLEAANPGLILERKRSSVALHYRQRPELAALCETGVKDVVANNPGLVILPGKMVFELKPQGVDKGVAVRAFVEEAPFKGRVPVFVGDDVTDEHAFEVVNELGGMTVKIGAGETKAEYRTDRKTLFDWLFRLVERSDSAATQA